MTIENKIVYRQKSVPVLATTSMSKDLEHSRSSRRLMQLKILLFHAAVTCPTTLEYSECGSSCPPTCQIKKRNYVCPQRCLDGCRCGNGTVYDGQRCVPVQQCPCLHNKRHFAPNSVIKRDCNNW